MKKLIVITAAALFLTTGCATKSALSKKYQEGFNAANQQCIELQAKIQQYVNGVQVDLAAKNERLRRFNQLNEDNTLRTKKNDDRESYDSESSDGSYDDPETPGKKPTVKSKKVAK